ncbi:MAG: hypothetical protein GWN71_35290, partial [Gammaproteobacteria bacterium]|nr:hypothetical protein [Gemmatimonadota bacterium]NIU78628.1 hypothetical protein [Gammaproteobacteria bacterium]NIY11854.1 hypothetical protein [Gemmatimonadota bacterium]
MLEEVSEAMPTSVFHLAAKEGGDEIGVTVGVTIVTLTPSVVELKVGETVQLEAVVTDAKGRTKTRQVRWSTTHAGIAAVGNHGEVRGVAPGIATIA